MSISKDESGKRPAWLQRLALILFIVPISPFVVYRAWRFSRAQDSNDPEKVIDEIHKLNRLSWIMRGKHPKIGLKYRAKIAEQRVLQNRLDEAQQELSAIREALRDKQSVQARYLRFFAIIGGPISGATGGRHNMN